MNTDIKYKLEKIELFDFEMDLVHPFRTSFGEEKANQSIIVKITDVNGNIGWGETVVSKNPGYSYETIKTAWHIQIDYLIPALKELNKGSFSIKDVLSNWNSVRGHQIAKGGIEAALWSLKAEQEGISLGTLYGASKKRIPTGVSIGIQKNIDKLLKRIDNFLSQGYKRIKIKIEPGWDVQVVKAIRDKFGDIPLMVDANSAYSMDDIEIMKQLDEFNLMMIEQPFGYTDLLEHMKLQKQIKTPICLDESIHSPKDAELALEFDCGRIINIKPGRVGGYYNAIKIAELAGKNKVWCGGMLETGIGRIHNIFFQARTEFEIPGDTSGSNRYYAKDIIDPPVTVNEDGYIDLPTGVGLGVEVDENSIVKHSSRVMGFRL